jgi:hypothetical protein
MAYNGKAPNGFNQLSSSLVALFVSGGRSADFQPTASQFYGSVSASTFVGDGSRLTNLSVDSLGDITTLKSGSATAQISPNQGLRVNTPLTVNGFLIVTGSQTLSGSLYLKDQATQMNIVGNGFGETYIQSLNGNIILQPVVGGVQIKDAPLTVDEQLTVSSGGATITGNSLVTGDLRVTGTVSASVLSTTFITSSQLDISTNIIKLNVATPSVR